MTRRSYRSLFGRCIWLLAVLSGTMPCGGCQSWNLRGDGFRDKGVLSSGIDKLRPSGNGQYFGLSNKAREIERSLGE